MGRGTKHHNQNVANTANTAKQRIAARNKKSDDYQLDNPSSAFNFQLKVRHHARKGVIRFGDEAASFGATRTPQMMGITAASGRDDNTGNWDSISAIRYKDVDDNQWYVSIKANMINVKHLLLAHDVSETDIIFIAKMGGYVVTQQTFDTLCINHPEFKDLY